MVALNVVGFIDSKPGSLAPNQLISQLWQLMIFLRVLPGDKTIQKLTAFAQFVKFWMFKTRVTPFPGDLNIGVANVF